jgi:hypothetical protein
MTTLMAMSMAFSFFFNLRNNVCPDILCSNSFSVYSTRAYVYRIYHNSLGNKTQNAVVNST